MIYELRSKIPQNSNFLYSEDVLTGTIFGNLRYFSDQDLLVRFLNEATSIDNKKLNIPINNVFQVNFWEKYRSKASNAYNEPDLILLNKDCVIIIECKYFSILDEQYEESENKPIYKNQLIRYSTIIDEYYSDKKDKIIIFLTNDKAKPILILENTIKNINKDINLYWLSWDKLYKCMINSNKENKLNEELLFNDILEFLLKRRLVYFNGFNVEICDYDNFYYRNYIFNLFIPKINWRYQNE
jgi:hypothetical protein